MREDEIQRLIYNTCDDDLRLLENEHNITPKSAAEALESIKDWYRKQPHLPPDAMDDHVIARHYAIAKGSIEKAKVKIDNMMSARSAMPEFFTNRDPFDPEVYAGSEYMEVAFVPNLTEQRRRIILMRVTDKDTSDFNMYKTYKQMIMMVDLKMRYDTNSGDIYVVDWTHFQLGHLVKTTPSALKKVLFLGQNCYGSRIQSMYMVNLPPYAKNTLTIIKSIVKKKIADRIHVINSLEKLHELVGKDYLPADLGGTLTTCRKLNDLCFEAMRTDEWVRWFKESETKKSDESRRPQNTDKFGDMLGITGSFKKLDID